MSFPARYRGYCTDCGGTIEPGQDVVYVENDADPVNDVLVHVKCPEEVPEIPPDVERCPRCTGHHRGEC